MAFEPHGIALVNSVLKEIGNINVGKHLMDSKDSFFVPWNKERSDFLHLHFETLHIYCAGKRDFTITYN